MNEYTEYTDEQLVALVQSASDNKAYSELVHRHQMSLLTFMYRFTNDKFFAEDLTQDTFIKAHEKISGFTQKSSFKTWLFSIGYREFLQGKRKNNTFKKLLYKIKEGTSPQYLMNNDLNMDLNNALMHLTTHQKFALLLCDAFGMTHSEASIALDTPLGSLKTYLKQARKIMHEYLEIKNETETE